MRISALLVCVLFACACNQRGSVPFSPGEFPWVVSLPTTVRLKGEVRFEPDGQYEFTLRDRREMVRGEKWAGHVTAAGFSAGDHPVLAVIENSMVTKTGWESLYRDEARNPPLATLRRTRGGVHFWASLEGGSDDLSITVVHRK
jgi:hypothetical protein